MRILGGGVRPVPQILSLLQPKECHYPHPFSDLASKIHTRFQTWPLRNNVIIRTATKKFLKIHFEFANFSFFLTHLELKR